MPTDQDINDQQAQLHQARLTLQQLLQQTQQRNPSSDPLALVQQLMQAQADIAHAKTLLRGWGVAVADQPDDALSARDLFGEVLRLNIADQRKGLFADRATFHRDVIGYQENTTIHLPPPAPPMPLEQALSMLAELPLDHVPAPQPLPNPHRMDLRPNPLFVGRVDELHQIAAQLKAGATVLVTAGIGGVGKTQLAVEVAHRYGRYFGGGVFWLSFADPGTIAGEVAVCGRSMGAFHDAEKLEQTAQVQRTLARWANGPPCLLIFDNCEDEALLREWQPKTGQSRVLVTTRHQGVWSPELDVQLLALDVLAREESIALLQRLAPRLAGHEADLIAHELGDLPLALHLAGRYLALYRSVTVAEYLANLRSPDLLAHRSLTGHQVKHMPTEREPHVARVFALSFDRLDQDDPADVLARQLLARAACFAPGEPFAQNWLEATVEVEGDTEARTDATNRLLALGLLEQDGDWLRLHRLLVAYAQQALHDDAALPAVERVVNRVAAQANSTKVPQAMLPVLPHLRHLVRQAQEGEREDAVEAKLHSNLDYYLTGIGAYQEALFHSERALAIRERVLGSDHRLTATSLNNLALLYKEQGAYERALPLYERALAIKERVLGNNHPATVTILHNLAGLYYTQGIYERALPLYERALAVREQAVGSDHPDTATSLNGLAVLLEAQGAYEQALPLYERALVIHERVLGNDHPDTAGSLSNLAGLYRVQGAYEQALPLYERALAIKERVLGSDHPATATSMNNLATLLEAQGAYEQALPLYERALAIKERVLGSDHPDMATNLNNLAGLYRAQGAYEQALPLYERALAIKERVLGSDHPDTATSLNNLAGLYRAQGAYEQALPLYERALAIKERVLGSDHPDTATSLNNLAALHYAKRDYERALPLYERALAVRERVLGSDHPYIATSLSNLAALLEVQGEVEQALALYERALAIKERVLGSHHPDTATSLNNLAVFHANQGAFSIALSLLERALQIWQARLGPQHPHTVQAQQSLEELRRRMVIAALPETVRAAVQVQDGPALQQALQALPPDQAQAVISQLKAITMEDDPL